DFESEGVRLLDRWFRAPSDCPVDYQASSCFISNGRSEALATFSDGATYFSQEMIVRGDASHSIAVLTTVRDIAADQAKQTAKCGEHPKDYEQAPVSKSLF